MALIWGRTQWLRSKGSVRFLDSPPASFFLLPVSSLKQFRVRCRIQMVFPTYRPCCIGHMLPVGLGAEETTCVGLLVTTPVSCYHQRETAHTGGMEWGLPSFQTHSGSSAGGSLV